jgi:hypothetical protein
MTSSIMLALAVLVAAVVLPCWATAGGDGSSGEPPVQRANPIPGTGDAYWTPERLREARPIEMPHPATPPPSASDSSAARQPGGEAGSVSEGGSPGADDVAPDETNYLFPPDALPNGEPSPEQ